MRSSDTNVTYVDGRCTYLNFIKRAIVHFTRVASTPVRGRQERSTSIAREVVKAHNLAYLEEDKG